MKFAKNNNFSGIQLAVESPYLSFEHLSHEKRVEIKDFCKNKEIVRRIWKREELLQFKILSMGEISRVNLVATLLKWPLDS